MHMQPMPESAGTFQDRTESTSTCPRCGKVDGYYQTWESSCGGYEDYKHTCHACGHTWWVDGIDS